MQCSTVCVPSSLPCLVRSVQHQRNARICLFAIRSLSHEIGYLRVHIDRRNNSRTFETWHVPPLLVLIPRAESSAAMARSASCPAPRISSTTTDRSAAKAPALADTAALSASPPFPARRRLSAPFGLPSFTPRALATAGASFVRPEIASRSACATSAMIPTVRSFASGMSTATKRTPLSRRAKRNAAFRLSWSSLTITSVAPVTFARCSALASSGRSAFRPLSTSVNRANNSAPREIAKSSMVLRCASRPRPG